MNEIVPFQDSSISELPTLFADSAKQIRERVKGLSAKDAFDTLGKIAKRDRAMLQGSMLHTCHTLALQWEAWESLTITEQMEIGVSFYNYVAETYGVSNDSTTIRNYIRTARVWLFKDSTTAAQYVPETSIVFDEIEGEVKPVLDENEAAKEVSVSVWDVTYSKLLASNSRAAKGQMEEEDWGLLFNPKVSQATLISHIRTPNKPKSKSGLLFFSLGNILYVSDGESQEEIGEVRADIEHVALALEGWNRLKKVMRVREMGDAAEDDF